MERKEYISHDVPVVWSHIQSEQVSEALGRPCGQYITLKTGPLDKLIFFENVCSCLVEQLQPLLAPYFGKTLCVCGLGNQDLAPDALGPEVARRFRPKMFESFVKKSRFGKIAMICPGTNGCTNLSTVEIIAGIVNTIHAACVLVVDASYCGDVEDLCGMICLTDSGLHSYWDTVDLRQSSAGVPVITIGVPTATRAPVEPGAESGAPELLLTPINVSDIIQTTSSIIACAIAQIAYPELDYESCKQYIGFSLNNII